ncbi:MAG TPA: chromosomal replication initiator protein DnaA [Candidatus Binatia bacterium]|nr:chromosomal replication initiator protein DnaA [Candidatus Binatia bacterium]
MGDTIWLETRRRLRAVLSEQGFQTWIAPLRAASWDGSALVLEVPSTFFRDWLKRHHLAAIEEAAGQAAGGSVSVRLLVNRALAAPQTAEPPPPAAPTVPDPAPGRYTFDTFVVGASNAVAYRAARAVVERPGARFNPLFVHGGVGLGKTHLLGAVAHALSTARGVGRVACLSAENFVNEMIAGLRRDRMDHFRRRFRHIGTLIVDDVQFLAGKVRSQAEFVHTFNALYDGRKQIVLASDRPPHELPGIEETLRSRFASGLLVDVRPPDPTLRVALTERKAADAGMVLDPAVVQYLAAHRCDNVRQLEGALARVDAFATLTGRAVTPALVREALAGCAPARRDAPSVERIVGEVCLHYKVTRAEIVSPSREARIAVPRQVAMYLCRRHTDVSLREIGAHLGRRDHSTVLHALSAIEERLGRSATLRETMAALESRLAT